MANFTFINYTSLTSIDPVNFVTENCSLWDSVILGSYQFVFVSIVAHVLIRYIGNAVWDIELREIAKRIDVNGTYSKWYINKDYRLIDTFAEIALYAGWMRIIQVFLNLKFVYGLIQMKNYHCNHVECKKEYVTLGKWFEKHSLKYHEGVLKAKRLTYFKHGTI